MSTLVVQTMAWMAEGRSRRLCKCERGWASDIGGGGNPLVRAGCGETLMSRCTIVVNWLAWSFVVQVGVGSMVWAFEVRGPIGVK